MQVIVFASQKGGSGKTTLTGHLAVAAGRAGYGPVGLVDTDPQGSLCGWWKHRDEPLPSLIRSTASELEGDLNRLRDQGHRLAFIDTPPAATSAISEVIRFADLVVVPCRPSPHDLRAVGATVDMVEKWRKPLVFAVNSATKRARITAEAAVALSQHGTVAPVTLHHRVDFAASMIDGRTVMEVNENCVSAKEVTALWEYVAERMGKVLAQQMPMPAAMEHAVSTQPAAQPQPQPQSAVAPAQAVATEPVEYQRTGTDDVTRPAYGPAVRRQAATFGRRHGSDIH